MKRLNTRGCWLVLLAGLLAWGSAEPVRAAEGRDFPMERLEQLEQRVMDLAERQDQAMRRLDAQLERRDMPRPLPPEAVRPPAPPAGPSPAAMLAKRIVDAMGLMFLIGVICNILLAVWIYSDIRKRGEGPAIFIAVALLAGLPAALIYAITRIGDLRKATS